LKDGKVSFFLTAKADALFHQKIKAAKLQWTQAWRRMNKKGKVDESAKKRTRKATKFQKAIVGMSLEDIKKKKAQKPELRQARMSAKSSKPASGSKTAAKTAVPKAAGKKDKLPEKAGKSAAPGKAFKGKK